MRFFALCTALLPMAVSAKGLDLAQALKEAATQGPDAQIVRNSVDSAHGKVRSVESIAWPTISGYANAGLGQQPVGAESGLIDAFGALGQTLVNINHGTADSANGNHLRPLSGLGGAFNNDPYYNYAWGVKVQQALFTFGKVSTALRMAKTQERITTATSLAVRQSIQSNVVDLYIAAVLAQAHVEVLKRSMASQEETVKSLERNFANGAGEKARVLLARAKRISVQQDIIAAVRDARTARQSFNRILGRPSVDTTPLDTTGLSAFEVAAPMRETILQTAETQREDHKTVRESRHLLEDLAFIDKAAYYPTVAAMGKFGFSVVDQNASSVRHGADWDNRDWTIGVGMTWNIFDGWSSKGDEDQTRAMVRTLSVREGDMVRGIEIGTDTYLRDKEAADSALSAAIEGVSAAREARDLFHATLSNGGGSLADLLSSEDGLSAAEFGWLSARMSRAKACIHLSLVQGKDLISLPEAP